LDNVLTLQRVSPAPDFTPGQLVSPQLIAELRRRSGERIHQSEEFAKEMEKIAFARESRARRATPLNKVTYLEEMQRFNADEWEREELEEALNKEKTIKRDFYVDEVLAITIDYMRGAAEVGIVFPRERTIMVQPRRSGWLGLGF